MSSSCYISYYMLYSKGPLVQRTTRQTKGYILAVAINTKHAYPQCLLRDMVVELSAGGNLLHTVDETNNWQQAAQVSLIYNFLLF